MGQRVICLTCEAVMPPPTPWTEDMPEWHKPGCRDVGVIASNWYKREGVWYLKGTKIPHQPMR